MHDASKVLLGSSGSSLKAVTNEPADPETFPAGLAVRKKSDGGLQLLIQDAVYQTKEPDEIGFARAVGANQYVESPQFQIAFSDGFVSMQNKSRDLIRVVNVLHHCRCLSRSAQHSLRQPPRLAEVEKPQDFNFRSLICAIAAYGSSRAGNRAILARRCYVQPKMHRPASVRPDQPHPLQTASLNALHVPRRKAPAASPCQ